MIKFFLCGFFKKNTTNDVFDTQSIDDKKFQDIRLYYDIKNMLSNCGTFGTVHLAICKRTKIQYAIKIIDKKKNNNILTYTDLKNELDLMKILDHKNIIKCIEVYENRHKNYIIMERCTGGDLFDFVINNNDRDKYIKCIVKQIVEGLEYLHNLGIAHCDIKLSNILMLSKKNMDIKIIDFGYSQNISNQELLHIMVGTPNFMAPEILFGAYNQQCDIWSLGCVIFILFFGFNPFNPYCCYTNSQIYSNILKGFNNEVNTGYGAFFPKSKKIDENARNFISNCFIMDYNQRMTAKEALRHPWLN